MRLNQFLATHTTLSRRSADEAIKDGRVSVNDEPAELGQTIADADLVKLDDQPVITRKQLTIMLYKPTKIICSRAQQGNVPTVYSLLPAELQHLSYIGRLDKDTSGLLLMSNDGELIQRITHPSHETVKRYRAVLDKSLSAADQAAIQAGVELDDGPSAMQLTGQGQEWTVSIHEGRNRQIRRTFEALGYQVTKLHRFQVGSLELGDLKVGEWRPVTEREISQ